MTGPSGQLLAHAAQARRKDLRDAVVAARKAFAGWSGATAYNRGQVLYRIAEMMEGRHEQFAAEVAAAEGGRSPRPPRRWTRPSTAGSGTPAGPTSTPRWPAARTRSPGRTSTSRCPSRPAWSALSRRRSRRCSGFVSVVAPVIDDRQHRRGAGLARAAAAGGVAGRGAGHLGPAGRGAQPAHRFGGRAAPWLASHRDVNCLDLTGVALADRVALRQAAADNVKRVFSPAGWTRRRTGTSRLAAFVETKTVWHPDRVSRR